MSLVKQKGEKKKSAETVSASALSSERTPLCLPCDWTLPALWTLELLDYVKGVWPTAADCYWAPAAGAGTQLNHFQEKRKKMIKRKNGVNMGMFPRCVHVDCEKCVWWHTHTTHTCDWLVSAQRSRHCGKPLVTMETVTSEPEDPRDSSNPQDCNTQLHYHRHYESRRQTHQQAWQPANALHRLSTGNYKLLMKQLPFKWGKSCSEKSPTPKLNAFTTLTCKV